MFLTADLSGRQVVVKRFETPVIAQPYPPTEEDVESAVWLQCCILREVRGRMHVEVQGTYMQYLNVP